MLERARTNLELEEDEQNTLTGREDCTTEQMDSPRTDVEGGLVEWKEDAGAYYITLLSEEAAKRVVMTLQDKQCNDEARVYPSEDQMNAIMNESMRRMKWKTGSLKR